MLTIAALVFSEGVGIGRAVAVRYGSMEDKPAVYQYIHKLKTGDPAPEFRLPNLANKAVALSDFRGKVVYLDFWFSGCKPCLAEAPATRQLQRQFRGRDLVFVSISVDSQDELWLRTIKDNRLAEAGAVHLLDPGRYRAANAYRIDGFPAYLIIGRDGRILNSNPPRPSQKGASQALNQALASK